LQLVTAVDQEFQVLGLAARTEDRDAVLALHDPGDGDGISLVGLAPLGVAGDLSGRHPRRDQDDIDPVLLEIGGRPVTETPDGSNPLLGSVAVVSIHAPSSPYRRRCCRRWPPL